VCSILKDSVIPPLEEFPPVTTATDDVQPITRPPADTPLPLPPTDLPVTVIENRLSWKWADFVEMWRFRETFFYLTLRDIRLRYKQTALGIGWSVFQPLATILVLVVFVGFLGNARGGMSQVEYVLFVIAGVIPWTFFDSAVRNAGNSLVSNERLVTRTYFPRVALPAANVFAALFDFSICLLLFALTAVGYAVFGTGVAFTWNLLLAPVVVLLLAILATGLGVFLSALVAAQRDFRFLITFGMQLWMFATPCIYLPPESYERWRWLLQFNPVFGLVYNFRASTLGTPLDWASLGIAATAAALAVVGGGIYFRRVERALSDTI
jgi:lipopolysaccharide transport system permease protein